MPLLRWLRRGPLECVAGGLLVSTALAGQGQSGGGPLLTFISPRPGASFVAAETALVFEGSDDQPLPLGGEVLLLNGRRAQGSFLGFSNMEEGRRRRWELVGALQPNMDYVFEVAISDADGNRTNGAIYFDTFDPASVVIEVEDYNFGAGRFFDSPVLSPEGMFNPEAYYGQTGVAGVDFFDAESLAGPQISRYRPDDPVATDRSTDFSRQRFLLAGGAEAQVFDYVVRHLRAGEWRNYTHTFAAGTYELRLRQSVGTLPLAVAALDRILGSASAPEQVTRPLGVFLATRPDTAFRTVPLTDATGEQTVMVRLNGTETLRLRQATDDPSGASLLQNFLVAIPVVETGPLRPVVTAVAPWPGEQINASKALLRASIADADTKVAVESIRLFLNGVPVSAAVEGQPGGVTFAAMDLPVSGTTNRVELRFADNEGVGMTNRWGFLAAASVELQLESALKVDGPYVVEATAVFDEASKTVVVPLGGAMRFYRLRTNPAAAGTLRIRSIQIVGLNAWIGYDL
jgi:hypothetical protein